MIPTPHDTAIHEACHIVVARKYGMRVEHVTVVTDGTNCGSTHIPNLGEWAKPDIGDGTDLKLRKKCLRRQRRALATYLAGDVGNNLDHSGNWNLVSQRLAELLQKLAIDRRVVVDGLEEAADIRKALDLSQLMDKEPMEEILVAESMARRILRAQWCWVAMVAKHLLEHKELGACQIEGYFEKGDDRCRQSGHQP